MVAVYYLYFHILLLVVFGTFLRLLLRWRLWWRLLLFLGLLLLWLRELLYSGLWFDHLVRIGVDI